VKSTFLTSVRDRSFETRAVGDGLESAIFGMTHQLDVAESSARSVRVLRPSRNVTRSRPLPTNQTVDSRMLICVGNDALRKPVAAERADQ
jgi:hypothetical protein